MKKTIVVILAFIGACLGSADVYAGYEKFEIKYGMHEKIVNEQYGDPVQSKTIKTNPIPIKKGLYKTGDTGYAVIYFFSGRIYKIVLLNDMSLDEAKAVFEED
jgi:hypothetical protein